MDANESLDIPCFTGTCVMCLASKQCSWKNLISVSSRRLAARIWQASFTSLLSLYWIEGRNSCHSHCDDSQNHTASDNTQQQILQGWTNSRLGSFSNFRNHSSRQQSQACETSKVMLLLCGTERNQVTHTHTHQVKSCAMEDYIEVLQSRSNPKNCHTFNGESETLKLSPISILFGSSQTH